MPNESSYLLPYPSLTPDGATGGANHRSSRFSLTAAAGQPAAVATLVVIGLTIAFYNTSHHDGSASSLLGYEMSGNGKKVLKKALNCLGNKYSCMKDDNYSKVTLKRAYELPYAALFQDQRGQKKYEASDVTIVDDEVYSVCDNSWAISRFGKSLLPFNEENVQVGDPNRVPDEDSGYEAIFHHEGLFYVVRESVYHGDHEERKYTPEVGEYHAIIEELELSENDYTVVNECRCEFEFEGDSKGFEGAVGFPDEDGVLYIVGLCEGNHCSESRKNDVGNGRVVLMKKSEDPEMTQCVWETVRVVNIPSSAAFLDYSAIDITQDGRVAITSQEHSAVWLGQAKGIDNGIIDPIGFDFEVKSKVLQFPKDGGCHTIYCNIEGIHFMNDDMLMAVSDKMKSKGRQDFRCHDKDQSIHAFVIP
uniref:Phytase-like domain-containing protein n=1 Tax=Skeletonema marinoi TaxID=267567 RepID=A0A7S2Q461_9STRA|mmetsp:Transcript_9305/g.15820  ORF Transcript_9305/g.15820 Transcript_9305/m.15820 type:complete len:419 (+) Transcript_9305:43-1299(+)